MHILKRDDLTIHDRPFVSFHGYTLRKTFTMTVQYIKKRMR